MNIKAVSLHVCVLFCEMSVVLTIISTALSTYKHLLIECSIRASVTTVIINRHINIVNRPL